MDSASPSDLVLAEDFTGYELGPLSEAADPVHETHYLRKTVDQGPWTETSVYHTNPRPNVNIRWIVTEVGGRKVLKQTGINKEGVLSWGNFIRQRVLRRDMCPLLFFPALATGSDAWRDYKLEVSLVPLSSRLCGVLFRSQNGMQHYVFGLENGRARLMVRRFNSLRVLASRRHPHAAGAAATLSVSVTGDAIQCHIDGREVFTVRDGTFLSGGCGILANGPALFESVKVYMTPQDRDSVDHALAEQSRRRAAVQKQYPQMRRLRRMALPVTAPGRSIRFGDLSGRGDLEYLIVQAPEDVSRHGLSLTALDADGRAMWQHGEPRHDVSCRIRDVPVQIHDIDGDGRREVVCYSEGALHVLDAATGSVKHKQPGPAVQDGQAAGGRLNCDSIFICNLAGGARSADLLIKDVYSQVFAYDSRLEPLWHYRCNTGHYPFAQDIDGDGKEEVLIGYTLLSSSGAKLWSIPLNDHADAVAVIRSPATGERVVAIAASNEGFVFADVRGKKRRHLRIGHMQTITAGRLLAGSDDFQIATNTYWGNPGVIYILGLDGEIIHTFQPSIHGSPLSPVRWTRDPQDFILLSAAAGLEGGLYDARGMQVVAFPDDGHPELCHYVGDADGDGLDEIICWDHHELWVYRSEETGTPAGPPPARLPAPYNQSNYRSSVSQ